MSNKIAKPYLKWVGGKDKLIKQFINYYPKDLIENKIDTYIEPFIGGGSHLFYLIQNYNFNNVIISDLNKKLINTYLVIKNRLDDLIIKLNECRNEYYKTASNDKKDFYNNIRNKFNNIEINEYYYENIEDACYFIILNKLGFNGLFRLNKSGKFNVPFNKVENASIFDEDNLILISKLLQNVQIYADNYINCDKWINNNTFIYFDPPYRPLNKTSNFVSYTSEKFNEDEQINLSNLYQNLDKLGVKLMLSNSYVEDGFYEKYYNNFNLNIIYAKRNINSNGNKRGEIKEYLITNYK